MATNSPETAPITHQKLIARAKSFFYDVRFTKKSEEIEPAELKLRRETYHYAEAFPQTDVTTTAVTALVNGLAAAIMVERRKGRNSAEESPDFEVWLGGIHNGQYIHLGVQAYRPTVDIPAGEFCFWVNTHYGPSGEHVFDNTIASIPLNRLSISEQKALASQLGLK